MEKTIFSLCLTPVGVIVQDTPTSEIYYLLPENITFQLPSGAIVQLEYVLEKLKEF